MNPRIVVALGIVLLGLGTARIGSAQDAPAPAPAPPPVLDKHELLHKYVWSALGPAGVLHATMESGLEQWRGAPAVWPADGPGYAKRWLSEFGENAIGNTTKYSVARLLQHDPSFIPCECTGVLRRLRHGLGSPFLARTRDGRIVPSPSTIAGLAAENIIPAATWYPEPRGTRDGVRHAAADIVAKMGVDVVREFVPLFHRKPRKD